MNTNTNAATSHLHRKRPWSIERQTRLFAGLAILLGLALGCTVNMSWLGLSAFLSLGMIVSAVTDSSALATLIQAMPWNRTDRNE